MKYMSQELEKFSSQIRFAVKTYVAHGKKVSQFSNIVICGLGGSGIAGRIIKSYFQHELPLPVEIISDYELPTFVNGKTLVITSSYSGNTEETLAMYDDAKKRRATIIVLATGGKIVERAQKDGCQVYIAEKGFQPRMALGYSFTNLIQIFSELVEKAVAPTLEKVADKLEKTEALKEQSLTWVKQLPQVKTEKFIIITDAYFEAVAVRFAQQLQENAKCEAFVTVLPECNHNVIETYYHPTKSNFVLLNSKSQERVSIRFSFLKNLLEKQGETVIELPIKDSSLESIFDTIYFLDWASLQVAHLRGAVSNKIDNILSLKAFLDK